MLARPLIASASLVALVGCGPAVPSTARLVGITYTPDVGETVTTELDYDSDGRPERAEVQRGGAEIQEELFTFDDQGQLTEIEFTETDGAFTLTTTVTYRWSDGRITNVMSEGAGVDDPSGDNVIYTTSSEREIDYDDQGRIAGNNITASVRLEQTVDFIIFQTDFQVDITEDTVETYEWDDDGTLSMVQGEQTTLNVQQQDGDETDRSEEENLQTLVIDHGDGRPMLAQLVNTRTTGENEEGQPISTTQTSTWELSYTDEGQLDEVDEERRIDDSDPVTDNVQMRYDDSGRIEEIEDDDGRWEFEYDDEAASGATFRSSRLPAFFDMAGRPATHTVGLPTHLGY
jgi:YD repeat-containing protein